MKIIIGLFLLVIIACTITFMITLFIEKLPMFAQIWGIIGWIASITYGALMLKW